MSVMFDIPETKRVIFVDIDGPLLSDRIAKFHPENNWQSDSVKLYIAAYCKGTFAETCVSQIHFDPVAIGMLNKLYEEFPYEIVISSSWYHVCTEEQIRVLFQDINKIRAPFHEQWATPRKMSSYRINELSWWLKDNPGYSYIILDDPSSFHHCMDKRACIEQGLDPDAMIIVDPFIGLEYHQFDQMRKIFSFEDQ